MISWSDFKQTIRGVGVEGGGGRGVTTDRSTVSVKLNGGKAVTTQKTTINKNKKKGTA